MKEKIEKIEQIVETKEEKKKEGEEKESEVEKSEKSEENEKSEQKKKEKKDKKQTRLYQAIDTSKEFLQKLVLEFVETKAQIRRLNKRIDCRKRKWRNRRKTTSNSRMLKQSQDHKWRP